MTNRPVQHTGIPIIQTIQWLLDRTVEHRKRFRLFLLELQQLGAKHRSQWQSRHGRDKHDSTHHPSQLFEHDTGHTAHHCQREEYGNHRQRRCDNGNSDLIRSMNGCLFRIGTTLNMCSNIFQYYNGVVHHHTDSNRERRQWNDINRIPGNGQINKWGNQWKRDGDTDNQCCTPTSQEKEYHDYHKQQGIEYRFSQTVDCIQNVIGSIYDNP